MPRVDVTVETEVSNSPRACQLRGLFDVPPSEKATLRWTADLPYEKIDWQVGLIVGPSGCGKSTIARHLYGKSFEKPLRWKCASVLDDFDAALSVDDVSGVCQAVGFGTVPAWLRPYKVLSVGEQFRVTLARRLLEGGPFIVVDEYSSCVDRQVAKVGSHAVQKYVRRHGKQFVAVTCHRDVIDWLQPDWIFDPSSGMYESRSVQPRPKMPAAISPVPYAAWNIFRRFHYLTAELNPAARCFCLFVDGSPASFAAMLHRPLNKIGGANRPLMGVSRVVTLPDWQGLGLAHVLVDRIAAWYKSMGLRTHHYPAHPSFVRSMDRNPAWALRKRPGTWSGVKPGPNATAMQGGRPCAVFSYEGAASDRDEAERVFSYWPTHLAMLKRAGKHRPSAAS